MASKHNIKQPPIYNVDSLDAKLKIKLDRDKKQVDLFFDEIKHLVIDVSLILEKIKLSLTQSHIYHSDVSFNEKLKKICGDVICQNLTIIGIENKFTFFHFKIPGSNSIKQAVESANGIVNTVKKITNKYSSDIVNVKVEFDEIKTIIEGSTDEGRGSGNAIKLIKLRSKQNEQNNLHLISNGNRECLEIKPTLDTLLDSMDDIRKYNESLEEDRSNDTQKTSDSVREGDEIGESSESTILCKIEKFITKKGPLVGYFVAIGALCLVVFYFVMKLSLFILLVTGFYDEGVIKDTDNWIKNIIDFTTFKR